MSELQPQGEPLRKAVRWISERLQEAGCPPALKLLEEACVKFNLSPTDAEFLQRFMKENK